MQARSLSRREAIQRMLATAAALQLIELRAFGAGDLRKTIGTDPNLHSKVVPWDRILTPGELKTVTVLGDMIIPADDHSPAASAVGVPDFINEWVSAPYPHQEADRDQLRAGFVWLDEEARRRFQNVFAELTPEQLVAICDDICTNKPKPEFKKAASFFSKFRSLVAGGFYSTPEGWADLGYLGNKPLAEFPGPPPEVLKHVGLA